MAPALPPAVLSRAKQIKRDMAEWRARHQGKDFGREMRKRKKAQET